MSKNFMRLLLVFLTCALSVHAQVGSRTFTATAAPGADIGIGNIGSGIAWHQLTWNVIGDGTGCSVKVQQAPDNTTWSDLITSQVCTANGQSAVVNVVVNYIRINVTAFAGTGSVVVHWNGFSTAPNTLSGVVSSSGDPATPLTLSNSGNPSYALKFQIPLNGRASLFTDTAGSNLTFDGVNGIVLNNNAAACSTGVGGISAFNACNTFNNGFSANLDGSNSVNGGTYTTDVNPLNLTWVNNAGGVTFNGAKWTLIDAASAAGSKVFQIFGGTAGTTNLFSLNKTGILTLPGIIPTATTVVALPSAASSTGTIRTVSDSTAVAAEGQTCVGGSTNTALAFSNGTVWKCF